LLPASLDCTPECGNEVRLVTPGQRDCLGDGALPRTRFRANLDLRAAMAVRGGTDQATLGYVMPVG
jgi:hypothetical protein